MLVSYATVFAHMYALWPDSIEDFYLKEYECPSENDCVYTAVESVRGVFAVIPKREGCTIFKPIPIYANGSVVEPLDDPQDIDRTHEADFSTVDTYTQVVEVGGESVVEEIPYLKVLHHPDIPGRFEYDFQAQKLHSISGTLRYRDGVPIMDEEIYIANIEPVTTGDDGSFIKENLPDVNELEGPDTPDEWFIAVPVAYNWDPPEGEHLTWHNIPQSIPDIDGQFYILTISKTDEDITDLIFIAENPTISGHVRDGGVNGTSLTGVEINFSASSRWNSYLPGDGSWTVTTGPGGTYASGPIYNGWYSIRAQDPVHTSYDFGLHTNMKLEKSATLNFYTYVISGRVVDEEGVGVNGLTVLLDDQDRAPYAGGPAEEYTATTGNGPQGQPGYYEQRVIEGNYIIKVNDGQ
jgi:hypothetical protein